MSIHRNRLSSAISLDVVAGHIICPPVTSDAMPGHRHVRALCAAGSSWAAFGVSAGGALASCACKHNFVSTCIVPALITNF